MQVVEDVARIEYELDEDDDRLECSVILEMEDVVENAIFSVKYDSRHSKHASIVIYTNVAFNTATVILITDISDYSIEHNRDILENTSSPVILVGKESVMFHCIKFDVAMANWMKSYFAGVKKLFFSGSITLELDVQVNGPWFEHVNYVNLYRLCDDDSDFYLDFRLLYYLVYIEKLTYIHARNLATFMYVGRGLTYMHLKSLVLTQGYCREISPQLLCNQFPRLIDVSHVEICDYNSAHGYMYDRSNDKLYAPCVTWYVSACMDMRVETLTLVFAILQRARAFPPDINRLICSQYMPEVLFARWYNTNDPERDIRTLARHATPHPIRYGHAISYEVYRSIQKMQADIEKQKARVNLLSLAREEEEDVEHQNPKNRRSRKMQKHKRQRDDEVEGAKLHLELLENMFQQYIKIRKL